MPWKKEQGCLANESMWPRRARRGSCSVLASALVATTLCLAATNLAAQSDPPRLPAGVSSPEQAFFLGAGADASLARTAATSLADGMANVDANLVMLHHEQATGRLAADARRSVVRMAQQDGRMVAVEVTVEDAKQALEDLTALGMTRGSAAGSMVGGFLPIDVLDEAAALPGVRMIVPAVKLTNVGATTSQGDEAMCTDDTRTSQGINGAGIKVGVISDSYDAEDAAPEDVTSGDLPMGVQVLADGEPGTDTDEGRAMAQIVHDVAPGAALAFHTANGGQAAMAGAITALRNAGCHIIVDDIRYLTEPMYQDGVIAQAAQAAVNNGVAYFSAAGNYAANSYENGFNGNINGTVGIYGGVLHAWNGSADIYNQYTLPDGGRLEFTFQWDDPHFAVSNPVGASTNMAIYLVDNTLTVIAGSNINNIGSNPTELFSYTNTTGVAQNVSLVIERVAGPAPVRMKYIIVRNDATAQEYAAQENKATLWGTPNAAGAIAVGAAGYYDTPAFGTNPPVIQPFSSLGGTPIRWNQAGASITQVIRNKPEIVAPDDGNTTFFGDDIAADADTFPNFTGTSAAAPHAAGMAALLLQWHGGPGSLSPAQIRSQLIQSTVEMNTPGFDFLTGNGLINACAIMDDGDGVNGDVEFAVPSLAGSTFQPTGDGNGDDILDRTQTYVSSFPNAVTAEYLSLEATAGVQFSNITTNNAFALPGTPLNQNYPWGVWSFRMSGTNVDPGGINVVRVYLSTEPSPLPQSYWKTDGAGTWTKLPAAGPGFAGSLYNGSRLITLRLQDAVGATNIYDLNPAAGVIDDPGGFANGSVLAVDLSSFTATRTATGVEVEWTTAAELDTAGFNLWRGTTASHGVRISSTLIPAEGSASSGATYGFADAGAPAEAAAYWLEEIQLDGSSLFYGPATVGAAGEATSGVGGWMMY